MYGQGEISGYLKNMWYCSVLLRTRVKVTRRQPQNSKMSIVTGLYQSVFKRTSTFTLSILVGAVLFERIFDRGADYMFESINRGVSKNGPNLRCSV